MEASPPKRAADRAPASNVADAVIGLGLLALGGAVLWLSRDIPTPLFVPLTPAFFPRLLAGLLAALSLLLLGRGLGRPARGPSHEGPAAPPARLGPAVALFGALGAYIALVPWLGFFASTFLFVAGLGAFLGGRRAADLVRSAVVAAATTVVCYLVFTRYLQVLFPEGLLP